MSRAAQVLLHAALFLSAISSISLAQTPTSRTHISGSKWKAQGMARRLEKGSALAVKTLDASGRLIKLVEPDAHGKLRIETDFTYDTAGHLASISQLGLPGDTPRVRTFAYDAQGHVVSATSPEAGTTTYTYDANGNIARKTDALGHMVTYTWNAAKQLIRKQYSTGSPAAVFDLSTATQSRRSYLDAPAGHLAERVYAYDTTGKLSSLTVNAPRAAGTTSNSAAATSTYVVGFQYDAAGRIASLQYPDGRIVTQSWAANGLLRSVADDTNLFFSSPRYIPSSRHLYDVLLGNGVTLQQTFSKRGRLHELSLKSGDTALLDKVFGYTQTGSLSKVEDKLDAAGSLTYSYDELSRIRSVEGAASQDYRYDAFGNRGLKEGGTVLQRFDAHNRFDRSTGVTYDDAGEVTFDGTHRYAYDAEGLIVSVDDGAIRYQYDAEGNRIQKTLPDGAHDYVWYSGRLLAERGPDGTWVDYIYAGDIRIASVTTPAASADGTVAPPYTAYLVADPLGTTRIALSQAGTIAAKGTFAPFGEEVSVTGPTAASSISYSDEVHDPETGLDTYQYRSYNPKLGRWMSPDPSSLHFSRLTNSQTFNLYSFVTNDPLKYTDAYGLLRCFECDDYGGYDDGFDDDFGGGGGGGWGGYQFDDGSDDGGGYNGADPGADAGSNTCPVDACVTADPDPPVPTTPSDPTNTTVDDGCDPNFCVNVNAGPDPTLPIDPGSPYDPTVPYQPPPDPPKPPDVTKNYPLTIPCKSNSSQVMVALEGDFARFANFSTLGGLLNLSFAPPAGNLGLGSSIAISLTVGNSPSGPIGANYGVSYITSVTVSSISSDAMTFATVPGHVLYPANITFSASPSSAGAVNFNVSVSGNFANAASQIGFDYLGGDGFENQIWRHLEQQIAQFCQAGG